jgi:AAA domain-containing protein
MDAVRSPIESVVDPDGTRKRFFPREKILDMPASPPPMVIPGILYQGAKLLISAPSKARKSFLILELVFCVANGLLWWGRRLPIGRVLLLNLELMRWEVRARFESIRHSYGEGNFDNIEVITLRGKQFRYEELAVIARDCGKEKFTLAAIDPSYKLLVGLNEGDPGDITRFLAAVEAFADELNASAALSHHFAKGNAAAKDAIDRASGTGVWARDPDGLIALTPNACSENHYTVEVDLRSFAQVPKFVIRWQYPRFYSDTEVDPEDLRKPKSGPKPKSAPEDLAALLTIEENLSYSDFRDRVIKILGLSETTFRRRLDEALAAKLIFKSVADGGYQRPLPKQR